MMLICFFFFVSNFAGNGCSRSISVHPIIEPEEQKDNFDSVKQKHIEQVVDNLSLPKIAMLHCRTKSVDYVKYNISPEDCVYFRNCIQRRFEENEDACRKMLEDSAEKYRRIVFAPHVHQMNLKRNRRATLPASLPSQVSRSASSVSLD